MKKGILLITILLVIAGLSISIMMTIPREVRTLHRRQEQKLRDSLMAIENAINSALTERDWEEIMYGPDIPVHNYYYSYNRVSGSELIDTEWTNPGKSQFIRGVPATRFLDNLSYPTGPEPDRLGYLSPRSYRIVNDPAENEWIGPVIKNKPSRWVIMITEVDSYEELFKFHNY